MLSSSFAICANAGTCPNRKVKQELQRSEENVRENDTNKDGNEGLHSSIVKLMSLSMVQGLANEEEVSGSHHSWTLLHSLVFRAG